MKIVKVLLQGYSLLVGAVGGYALFFLLQFLLWEIESDDYFVAFISLVPIGVSCLLIFTAYEMLFRFSEKAVVHMSALTGVFVYILLDRYLLKYEGIRMAGEQINHMLILWFVSVLSAYFVYKVMRVLIVKIVLQKNVVGRVPPKGRG